MLKKEKIVKNISAKEVWNNNETNRIEEQRMSPFISEHIDDISEITGYDLEVTSMECFIGDFRADIICKDINTDDIIVIENQLENSDHSHLGKSLTYFSNLGAKAIVWICENFRPEHIKAIETLNEITGNEYNFYAIELKFESYNNSEPYYDFNKIVVPTYISKISQSFKNNISDDMKNICQFFDKFEIELKKKIHTVKHPKNKQYCKINNFKNGFYFGVGYLIKENKFIFELSKKNCTSDELDSFKLKVDELNKKYNFVYSLGKKNKILHKFLYLYENTLDYTNNDDLQKLMNICIDINSIIENK